MKINKLRILLLFCLIAGGLHAQTDLARQKFLFDSAMRATDEKFSDPGLSPLEEEDRQKFTGLSYFTWDSQLVVSARFERTPREKPFRMKTTTDRLPEYVKYGELHFQYQGQPYVLSVFRNLELSRKAGFENYLFIPFNDSTNGFETYGGGRYLDFRIPDSSQVTLDFNLCYHPYCAYNHHYSCPIPPPENKLPFHVRAGVRLKD